MSILQLGRPVFPGTSHSLGPRSWVQSLLLSDVLSPLWLCSTLLDETILVLHTLNEVVHNSVDGSKSFFGSALESSTDEPQDAACFNVRYSCQYVSQILRLFLINIP